MCEHHPIPAEMRAEISKQLDAIAGEEGVRILFAVESGSRAWGFPSPDSDFDVRFVYARPRDWYLSIDSRRDVIERPIDGDLDINGWDLKKALQLAIKPNPVLLEWLRSPILYRAEADAMARLAAFAGSVPFTRRSTHHYLQQADSRYQDVVAKPDAVRLKTYFYALRAVLALRWLRRHPGQPLPMDFASLRSASALAPDEEDALDALLRRKAQAREQETCARVPVLDALTESELADATGRLDGLEEPAADHLDEANALFRALVQESEQ